MRVLIVEDDASTRRALAFVLDRIGYDVVEAEDGTAALETVALGGVDAIILDVRLPGLSGLDVCRELRRTSSVPILMVSALADEVDVVVGLEIGADDYITKPFTTAELIARLRAITRRPHDGASDAAEDPAVIAAGPVRLNTTSRTVEIAGHPVDLPRKQFDLLAVLASHPDQALSRERLVSLVWGQGFDGDERTLDVHVHRLRKALEAAGAGADRLVTVRGIGFRFRTRPPGSP